MGKQQPSKGEMEIVRALWEVGSGTVRQVHAVLAAERPIEFGTVQTYLRRLEAKGYVKSTLQGRVRVYAPRARPDRVIRETIDDVVSRLFGGQTMPLMRHLLEQHDLSGAEIQELRHLVDRLKEAEDDD